MDWQHSYLIGIGSHGTHSSCILRRSHTRRTTPPSRCGHGTCLDKVIFPALRTTLI